MSLTSPTSVPVLSLKLRIWDGWSKKAILRFLEGWTTVIFGVVTFWDKWPKSSLNWNFESSGFVYLENCSNFVQHQAHRHEESTCTRSIGSSGSVMQLVHLPHVQQERSKKRGQRKQDLAHRILLTSQIVLSANLKFSGFFYCIA